LDLGPDQELEARLAQLRGHVARAVGHELFERVLAAGRIAALPRAPGEAVARARRLGAVGRRRDDLLVALGCVLVLARGALEIRELEQDARAQRTLGAAREEALVALARLLARGAA